jgi:hypothetical protein
VYENVPVIDVSLNNDWTAVKFWNGAGYGKTYATHGFIENTKSTRLALQGAAGSNPEGSEWCSARLFPIWA